MVSKGWSCKSTFRDDHSLSRHLAADHSDIDVADLLVSTLGELGNAQAELEKLTFPKEGDWEGAFKALDKAKAEENKSEGAIP